MQTTITAEELFLRLYETALKIQWNQMTKHDQLGTSAAEMARELMPYACLIPGRSIVGAVIGGGAPPTQLAIAPQGYVSGIPADLSPNVHAQQTTAMTHPMGQGASRFGSAFSGWPEAELVQCLAAIQEIVLGRQYNANEEQQAASQANLQKAINDLFTARVQSAGKPKA